MISQPIDRLEAEWHKKDVPLSWEGLHLSFAVAQELFSSHSVDTGSLLLLRSLDLSALPETGTAVDFGCGYGVLGLALKAAKPGLAMTLIDRDALAVEFSAWNAQRLELDVTCRGGLGVDGMVHPADLVLWNVPGKAGADVLQRLTAQVLDRLAPGGLLALVVVHPLARDIEAVALARPDIEITHESAGPEHTVFHMKRRDGADPDLAGDAFTQGTFDREPTDVDTGLIQYRFTPVIGLPMYDGPDIATVLLTDEIEGVGRTHVDRAACYAVGQGHVPVYLRARWPDVVLSLIDRDLLALQASSRAVGGKPATTFTAAGIDPVPDSDVATAMIADQMRPPVMQRLLEAMVSSVGTGGHIAVGGGSTEVSRYLALARKRPELKLRGREKKRGFSAAIFERVK